MTQAAAEPLEFNPYAYEYHEDPYPTYARLRVEAPVYRNDERDFYALSRHADVAAHELRHVTRWEITSVRGDDVPDFDESREAVARLTWRDARGVHDSGWQVIPSIALDT